MARPSYKSGFATHSQSAHPDLWHGCIGAYGPALGASGSTLRDCAGRNNHGTLVNMTLSSDWVPDGLDFDGSNDHVKTIDGLSGGHVYDSLSDHITVAAWIKPSTITAGIASLWQLKNTVVELRTSTANPPSRVAFSFGMDNSGKIGLGVTDNYTTGAEKEHSSTTLTVDTQYLIGVTINGDDVAFYLDGKPDGKVTLATATGDRSPAGDPAYMKIACRSVDSGAARTAFEQFKGVLSELRIYNRTLTANQMSKLYRVGPLGAYSPARRSRARVAAAAAAANYRTLLGVGT